MKILFLRFLIFLIIIVIFFYITEICFRFFGHIPPTLSDTTQKQKKYLFEPNTVTHHFSSPKGEFEFTAHINKYGYRGKDFAMPKDKNTLRIFAIGDSFTFGIGAEDNQTIPFLIEEKLRSQNYAVEVINAGAGHTSPFSHYMNLKNIHLQYQPDLVLLLFDLTDLWDDWDAERHAIYDEKGEIIRVDPLFINGKRNWWLTCCYYSAFCRWINNKIVRSIEKIKILGIKGYLRAIKEKQRAKAVIINSPNKVSDKTLIEYDGLLMMRGRDRERLIREHWGRTAKYLKKIKYLLQEKNIPFIIIMYPHGIYVSADQWPNGRLTWGFEKGKLYTDYLPFEIMEEFTEREKIPFINTLDNFLKAEKKKYFFNWDGHLTPEGNKIIAEAITSSPIFKKYIK